MENSRNVEHNLNFYRQTLIEIKKNTLSGLIDAQLKTQSQALKKRAQNGELTKSLSPEVFAVVSEAVKRTLGLTPHDVQLLAATAMAEGRIVELPTGEGNCNVHIRAQ